MQMQQFVAFPADDTDTSFLLAG